ncbi:MAG: PKD domain-containing protein, partial [Pseudomonadota bacterium]|nr:PKD domain-containing protein [Pseudomonadota bacterium]
MILYRLVSVWLLCGTLILGFYTPVVKADNLSVSATATPTSGLNPLTVSFSGSSSGCSVSNTSTVTVSGIPYFGGFFNTISMTIQNNLSTPLTIWRANVILSQFNVSWGTMTLGGRTADATVTNSNTNYDYYFNQSGNPTSNQPVVNPYVIPAGGSAQMQLFFVFPIGGTSNSIEVNFYDPSGNSPGSVNLTSVDQWDFGDGTAVFNGDVVSHTYTLPGLYTAVFSTSCNLNVASQSIVINDEAPITPGLYDAVETGASPQTPIHTKIAGEAFSLDILATNSNGTINTTYTGTAKVEVVNAMTSSVCANMTAIQQLGNIKFTKNQERIPVSMTIPNSWQDLRLRMTELNNKGRPTGNQACSSDAFAVRPAQLVFSVTDNTWMTPGTVHVLNTASSTGGPIHKAGRPFTVTATAYNGAPTPQVTTNYQGSPTAVIKS